MPNPYSLQKQGFRDIAAKTGCSFQDGVSTIGHLSFASCSSYPYVISVSLRKRDIQFIEVSSGANRKGGKSNMSYSFFSLLFNQFQHLVKHWVSAIQNIVNRRPDLGIGIERWFIVFCGVRTIKYPMRYCALDVCIVW